MVAVKVQYLIVVVFVVELQYLMVVFFWEVQHLMVVVVVVEQIIQNKYYPIHPHFEPHQNVVRVPHHYPPSMPHLLYLSLSSSSEYMESSLKFVNKDYSFLGIAAIELSSNVS